MRWGVFQNGSEPPCISTIAARLPTSDDFQAMRDAYVATAPAPGAFDAVAQKTSGLVQSFTGWTDDQLRDVQVPVLILVGDTDFIHVENAAEAIRLLPQGQLAVLPGTTHVGLTRSTLLAPVIEAFLA